MQCIGREQDVPADLGELLHKLFISEVVMGLTLQWDACSVRIFLLYFLVEYNIFLVLK